MTNKFRSGYTTETPFPTLPHVHRENPTQIGPEQPPVHPLMSPRLTSDLPENREENTPIIEALAYLRGISGQFQTLTDVANKVAAGMNEIEQLRTSIIEVKAIKTALAPVLMLPRGRPHTYIMVDTAITLIAQIPGLQQIVRFPLYPGVWNQVDLPDGTMVWSADVNTVAQNVVLRHSYDLIITPQNSGRWITLWETNSGSQVTINGVGNFIPFDKVWIEPFSIIEVDLSVTAESGTSPSLQVSMFNENDFGDQAVSFYFPNAISTAPAFLYNSLTGAFGPRIGMKIALTGTTPAATFWGFVRIR